MSGMAFGLFGLVTVMVGGMMLMNLMISGASKRMEGKLLPPLGGERGEAASADAPSLFYFHSPSCGPCRGMTPKVEALREEIAPGRVFKIDISKEPETAMAFGVMATPTVARVRGGTVEQIVVGPMGRTDLETLLTA